MRYYPSNKNLGIIMTILFNSSRPLYRCENITALWEKYDKEKFFNQGGYIDLVKRGLSDYDIVVTDEFIYNKAPNQKIIMIGHGLNGGKLYGVDQPYGKFNLKSWQITD